MPSAFHRSHLDGAPIARVYSSADELVQSNIFVPAGSEGAGTTNLLEEHRDTLEYEAGGWPLRLRPWQIQTMRFGRRG